MERMSFSEARAKLKRYYRVLELANEYKISSKDIVLAIGSKQPSGTSPQEHQVVRTIDLLASVQDTADALGLLPDNYRQYIGYRFKDEFSYRAIARLMHYSKSNIYNIEKDTLAAFIAALGNIPDENKKVDTCPIKSVVECG